MDIETLLAVIGASILMVIACYFDWRYREIPDRVWWAMGIMGLVLTALSIRDWDPKYVMMLAGSVMILIDILWDADRPKWFSALYYILMLALFLYPMISSFGDPVVKRLSVIPICFVVFYILYIFGIVRGGADAKCLIIMGMVFQTYPSFGSFPLIHIPSGDISLIIAFPIAILFHAALFSFAWLFWIIMRKMYRKDEPVEMYSLSWYKMSIDDARRSFVWPKQDVVNGMVVRVKGIPEDGALDRLEQAGVKDVWVTPMIPFMIPIAIAMIFVIFVGNLLFIPFSF